MFGLVVKSPTSDSGMPGPQLLTWLLAVATTGNRGDGLGSCVPVTYMGA